MAPSSTAITKGRFAWLIGLLVVLGILLGEVYCVSHNSLYNNGNWSVTKTRLWNGLIGSYSFLFDLQPLSGGSLNVAAWHGRQEVVLEKTLDPASVEFDLYLARPGSYVTFWFNRQGNDYDGIRIGRHSRHPPALLKISEEGEFLRKRRLRILGAATLGEWHTVRVEFSDQKFSAFLDGRKVEKLEKLRTRVVRPQKIGFRGGEASAFIDNIRIVSRDGTEFVETFDRPRNWRQVYAIAIVGALALALGGFLLLRHLTSVSDKHLLFSIFMATGVLLVAAAGAWILVKRTSGFYPNASEKLERQEAYWKGASAEDLVRDIEEKYSKQPARGVHRFVVLGASQTAGAGASSEEETWVRQTERLLNERSTATRYEFINTAVRGYVLKEMVEAFETRWVHWRPRTVIVNASHNDRIAPQRFEKYLRRLLDRTRTDDIEVVLIQEPNAGRRGSRELVRLHQIMATLGEHYGVPVLDMQSPLAARGDDGFLWWDPVHMTNFGQKLFAEQLVAELIRLEVVEFETQPSRALER